MKIILLFCCLVPLVFSSTTVKPGTTKAKPKKSGLFGRFTYSSHHMPKYNTHLYETYQSHGVGFGHMTNGMGNTYNNQRDTGSYNNHGKSNNKGVHQHDYYKHEKGIGYNNNNNNQNQGYNDNNQNQGYNNNNNQNQGYNNNQNQGYNNNQNQGYNNNQNQGYNNNNQGYNNNNNNNNQGYNNNNNQGYSNNQGYDNNNQGYNNNNQGYNNNNQGYYHHHRHHDDGYNKYPNTEKYRFCPNQTLYDDIYRWSDVTAGYPVNDITAELVARPTLTACLARTVTPDTVPQVPTADPMLGHVKDTCNKTDHRLYSYFSSSTANAGRCWVLQNFQEPVFYVMCTNRFCRFCKTSHSKNFETRCIKSHRYVGVYVYCENRINNERIVYDRLIIPDSCNCKGVYCYTDWQQ